VTRIAAWKCGVLAGLASVGGACLERFEDPRPQWMIHVSTDAQVPGFGSRLLIEVSDANDESGESFQRRVFDVSNASAWPVSFGIVPGATPTPRVRARLFRADQVGIRGEPDSQNLIDRIVRLPEHAAPGGIQHLELPMPMVCFGTLPDGTQHSSCAGWNVALEPEVTLSTVGRLELGSWKPSVRRPCQSTVPEGMICQPGGAYFLGASSPGEDPFSDPVSPPRVVQLSAFALDAAEMTIGVVRGLIATGRVTEEGVLTVYERDKCTYKGVDDATRDAYPLNCVDWKTANLVCELLGKRLPTESEWEYAAGNLSDKTLYPWGDDPDACSHTVVARNVVGDTGFCIVGRKAEVAKDGEPKDITALGVRNLAGNLAEWTSDISARYDSNCWPATERLMLDPTCSADEADGTGHSVRGGAWNLQADTARVSRREVNTNDDASVGRGFRCALSL
jgi:formylglycine-generating enzyme required for sulfatase activity